MGGCRNGNSWTGPKCSDAIFKITEANEVRIISGSVNAGLSSKSSSSYKRIQTPGDILPHRPDRWLADA